MNLVSSLRKNNGVFDLHDFYDNESYYERVIKSLLKKDKPLAYKCLKYYFEEFKKIESEPILSYRPGMDYRCSFYCIYQYSLIEKNKKDRDRAYLILLKRFNHLPSYIQKRVIKKKHILLKHAYPDMNDLYSSSLNDVGNYLYKRKRYREAFRFYKKGADFSDTGRQIEYPFYLMALNQDKVGDMYRDGLGAKKIISLAKKYYRLAAENCGLEYHPKMGDFEYEKGNYTKAFLYYTNGFDNYSRYDQSFLDPKDLMDKFKVIFEKLNSIPEEKRHPFANLVLSVMYYYGYGCEEDIEKSKQLLPDSEKNWAIRKYSLNY